MPELAAWNFAPAVVDELIFVLFNSYTFILFLCVVWMLYYAPFNWHTRKLILLVASYVFYAAWSPPFVLLLILAAVMDFSLARWLGRSRSRSVRRSILVLSLSVNLGLLGYFKYGTFLLRNVISLLTMVGIQFHPAAPDIVLPLGISFFTFETISYLIDVYRGKIEAWDSFVDYALFLTFFPHLIAGPIVRANDFLPQCREPRQVSSAQFGWGLSLIVLGLWEKIFLADGILAPVADQLYSAVESATFLDGWIGTLAFAGQIFFDFAGYSTCGIGVALTMGFVLNDNFHFPYAAVGFSDFWRRWHISLSTWLRDYLYIPLGGNRRGEIRTHVNLMLTMLIGGLWHGAAWRFVAWGGLHGLLLEIERFLRRHFGSVSWISRSWVQFSLANLTFGVVCLTWVFFRADNFSSAFQLIELMVHPLHSPRIHVIAHSGAVDVIIVVCVLLLVQWWLRNQSVEFLFTRMPWWLRSFALAMMMVLIAIAPGDNRAFIYFQF